MSLTTRAAIGSRSQLAAAYHPGDGQISLATGGGAFWAGASSGSPGYLLLISGDEQQVCSVKTVYSCTGVTADVLTGVDQYFPAGSTAWLCTDTGGGGAVPPNCQQPIVSFSGTATSPGVPGSGSNYMLIDVNTSTGAITTQTGTSPLNPTAGTWQLLAQTIATGQPSAISQQTGITIPWLSTVSPN